MKGLRKQIRKMLAKEPRSAEVPVNPKDGDTAELPGTGWRAEYKSKDAHQYFPTWYIYDEEQRNVGFLRTDMHELYILRNEWVRNRPFRIFEKDFKGDVMHAIRTLYLEFAQREAKSQLDEGEEYDKLIKFKDIPGWKARRYQLGYTGTVHFWDFYDGRDNHVGRLTDDGKLRIFGRGLPHETHFTDINFGDDVHQAARYLFLDVSQEKTKKKTPKENLPEASLTTWRNRQIKDKMTEFPEIGGWSASKFHHHAYGNPKKSGDAWRIFDSDGYQTGTLFPDGLLTYTTEPGFLHDKKEKGFKDQLERAVMFVFLKNQKPASETGIAEAGTAKPKPSKDAVAIPGLDGWSYFVLYKINKERAFYVSHYDIHDDKNVHVARFYPPREEHWKFGVLEYVAQGDLPSSRDFKRESGFEDADSAAKYVYLKRQKPQSWLRKTIGRLISELEAVRSGDGTEIDIPGLPGWWAKRYEEEAEAGNVLEGRWGIYEGSKWVGTIWDTGHLELPGNDEDAPHLANDPVQAARLIYMKTQKPLSEASPFVNESAMIPDEEFSEGNRVGYTVPFDDLGYTAMLYKMLRVDIGFGVLTWIIYDNNVKTKEGIHPVAQLWQNGELQVMKLGDDMFGSMEDNWVLRDFHGNVEQAARYAWMKRHQDKQKKIRKHLSDAEKKKVANELNEARTRYETYDNEEVSHSVRVPSIEDWHAVVIKKEDRHWSTKNPNDYNYAVYIYQNGDLAATIHDKGELLVPITSTDKGLHRTGQTFDPDDNESVSQAIRLLWMKSQQRRPESRLRRIISKYLRESEGFSETDKPANDFTLGKKITDTIQFPEFGYRAVLFKAKIPRFGNKSLYGWHFFDNASKDPMMVGVLYENGKLMYELKSGFLSEPIDFGTNIENAVRFIWLNRQDKKNISEAEYVSEVPENPKGYDMLKFPELGSYSAGRSPDLKMWHM